MDTTDDAVISELVEVTRLRGDLEEAIALLREARAEIADLSEDDRALEMIRRIDAWLQGRSPGEPGA